MIVIETASLAQLEVLTKMFEAYRKFYRKPPKPQWCATVFTGPFKP